MKKRMLPAIEANIASGVDFVQQSLQGWKLPPKTIAATLLTIEELLAQMVRTSSAEGEMSIKLYRAFGAVDIQITCLGSPFDASDLEKQLSFDGELTPDEALAIQNLTSRVSGSHVHIAHRRGLNICTVAVKPSEYKGLISILCALCLGIVFGLLMKLLLPESWSLALVNHLLAPVSTMFLNALKTVVAPLVLFSIASSIADFDNLKALGRIAARVMGLYVLTSLLAIGVGYLVYQVFPIGDPALQSMVTDAASATIAKSASVSLSIQDTIVGIIPTDFITPFQKGDMLQVIFLAVLLGLGAAMLSGNDSLFAKGLKSANAVFSKVVGIIIWFMPAAVFCSMAKMMLGMQLSSLLNAAAWIPVCYAGHFAMILVYFVLLFVLAGLNPLRFLKGFAPVMAAAFSSSSSNVVMPLSMKHCGEKLGISPRIYSFSIPLGATVNMDGSCITLIITALFAAKIFGLPVTPSMLVSMVITIIALSLGSPGVPGGNLVCMSILLPTIGIPAEAISIVMGFYSLIGMSQTMTNVTGDAVVTSIVAKWEKAMDIERFGK
ncbi:MAG: cation:dicarboxylate symporter family transporter [Aristaeellaceae bacterium]